MPQCKNYYLILGHGITKINTSYVTVPENVNIVTFSKVGNAFKSSLNDLIFMELFSTTKEGVDFSTKKERNNTKKERNNTKNYVFHQLIKLISSPFFGNHKYLNDLDIKLHPPNCQINDIKISFGIYHMEEKKGETLSIMNSS